MAKQKQLSEKEMGRYEQLIEQSKERGTFQKALGHKTPMQPKTKFKQIDVSLAYPQKNNYKSKVMAKYGPEVYKQAEMLEQQRAESMGMQVAGSPDTQAKIIENRIMMAQEAEKRLQKQQTPSVFSRMGSGFKKSFQDFTGQTAGIQRAEEIAAAKELALEVALSRGQIPKFIEEASMAPSPSQLQLRQSAPSIGVVPVSSLQTMGQTMARNVGFQGQPSYDIATLPQKAEVYLGSDVFNVVNPSLPSYAQQAEKARVLTGQGGTYGRSPLDTIRDATGIVRQQQVYASNSDKIRDLTSQGMSQSMSPEMKIRMMTGAYQQPFEVGMPINPMNVQFQPQPFMQRTIDPYQQQMMQEMRAQRAAERQQQRAIEDQIVQQKVRSMNSIGSGVNVGMAGGVNLNKNFGAPQQQSNDYVESPREAGVTTPASRPVTYRRGPYQKHQ